MVLFDSFYYIVVMLLTYQHNKILMRAKPRGLLVFNKNIITKEICRAVFNICKLAVHCFVYNLEHFQRTACGI